MRNNQSKQRVCIVIPAYNEGPAIGGVIKGLKEQLKSSGFDYEIVVVDDSSSDDTAKVSRDTGAFVISHVLNTGSGGATATGLSYARRNDFDLVVTLDADGQHDPKDVLAGIKEMEKRNVDLLIGSRLINTEGMSKVKVIGNKGLSALTNLLFGVYVTDSQSGLRVFSRRAIENLKWQTSGYEFCSEMLWRAKQQKLKIAEYPIRAIYTDYSRSKGQNNWNAFNIIKSLVSRRFMELFR